MQIPALGQSMIFDSVVVAMVVALAMVFVGLAGIGTRYGSYFELVSLTHDYWPPRLRLLRDCAKVTYWCGVGLLCLGHVTALLTMLVGMFLLRLSTLKYLYHLSKSLADPAAKERLREIVEMNDGTVDV